MAAIVVVQQNGARWLATHCEVVIPVGGTDGMFPAKVRKTIAHCEELSKRLAAYRGLAGCWKEYFQSVEEFERYKANPALARAERPPQPARTARPGVIYLARGNGSYKIGRSSSFADREHHLTVKLPFPSRSSTRSARWTLWLPSGSGTSGSPANASAASGSVWVNPRSPSSAVIPGSNEDGEHEGRIPSFF